MNFSPQARPVKLEGSPTYPYVRLQSIPVAHLVVDGRRKLLEPPQFNQPILVFSEPTAALFNQELTELSNFLALESMGFQPYFAYSHFFLALVRRFVPAQQVVDYPWIYAVRRFRAHRQDGGECPLSYSQFWCMSIY